MSEQEDTLGVMLSAAATVVDYQEQYIESLRARVRYWMKYATGQNTEANALAAEVADLRERLEAAAKINTALAEKVMQQEEIIRDSH